MRSLPLPDLASDQSKYPHGYQMALHHRQAIALRVPQNGRFFEWGSGASTDWFRANLPDAVVVSCEHDAGWALRAGALLMPVRAGDYGTPLEEHWHTDPSLYVHAPSTCLDTFDVMLVDGVVRNLCLLAAVRYLKPDGVIVLHDSQRSWYACGRSVFRTIGELPEGSDYPGPSLWMGVQ